MWRQLFTQYGMSLAHQRYVHNGITVKITFYGIGMCHLGYPANVSVKG